MIKVFCERCEGSGIIILDPMLVTLGSWTMDGRDSCPKCNGKGYIEKKIEAKDLWLDEQQNIVDSFIEHIAAKTGDVKLEMALVLVGDDWPGIKDGDQ